VEDYCWRFNMPWSPNMSTWYLLALISRRFYCEFQTTTAERPTSLHWGLSTDAWNQDVAVACRLVDALWPVVISCRCVDARTKAPSWCRVDQRAISGTHNVRVRSISPSLCFSLSLSLLPYSISSWNASPDLVPRQKTWPPSAATAQRLICAAARLLL
jgi:hypothetical protein